MTAGSRRGIRIGSLSLVLLLLGSGSSLYAQFGPVPEHRHRSPNSRSESQAAHAHPGGTSSRDPALVLRVPGTLPEPTRAAAETTDPHFGRTLLGSALGAAVGAGVGGLLLKGAAMAESDTDREDRINGNVGEPDPATIAAMIGIACVLGGAPFGAVRMGRIEQDRTGAYVLAGVGEFVVGALGYALAHRLHRSTPSRLVGVGSGVVVGAAGGVMIAASQREQSIALVGYESGEWNVSPPDVRMRSNLGAPQSPTMTVSLLSLRL